jgi:hydroxyacylglutathione hydrolase
MTHALLGDFGVLSLSVVVTSPPWYENCYLVRHNPSGATVVVDPGGDADKIRAALDSLGATPTAIWLTHGHPDHLGAADALERAFGLSTLAHPNELDLIAMAGEINRSFTGQGMAGPTRVVALEAQARLTLGDHPVAVIPTPGHTPGGVCYDFGPFVLTGDTLFRQGVGRTDLPGGDEGALWSSISRLLDHATGNAMLFSGHGPGWPADEARRWWRMAV